MAEKPVFMAPVPGQVLDRDGPRRGLQREGRTAQALRGARRVVGELDAILRERPCRWQPIRYRPRGSQAGEIPDALMSQA
jgi:hypothetical protein